jgi:hypothetical protein
MSAAAPSFCLPMRPIPELFRILRYGSLLAALLAGVVQAQDSPHGPGGQPCSDCHTTAGWTPVLFPLKFDHDTTAFPLRGEHRNTTCLSCHTTLRFAGTPTECVSCHRKDYDAALAVNHATAGFGYDCTECHLADASSWLASFDHNKTNFPTRGIHESVPCGSCHTDGRFRGTPTECVACHREAYLATTNPNHAAAGFSTDCSLCHRALTWRPAAFYPHDNFFPISSGSNHPPGRWNSCTDCHAAQPDYSTFECINCHAHAKSAMDSRHSDVSGYEYRSSACYQCHPTGSAGR